VSLAFLFPGQGSQEAGMLHTLPASPAVADTLAEATEILNGIGVGDELDTAAALSQTTDVQLALVVAGVACARALMQDHGLTPAFVAGHSVGAFAAAVTAGVLTLHESLVAVRLRGDLMRAACAGRDWGMGAVTGLPTTAARRLAAQTGTVDEPLWVANVNSATQTVLSGTAAALAAARAAAHRLGANDFDVLDVVVASHCPLQQGTAQRLAEHLAEVPHRTPTARYLTNIGGRSVGTAERVLDDLAGAVAHPVQWYDATRVMAELGATCAVQMRPGRVLARLLTSAVPSITSIALSDNDFGSAAATARRRSGPLGR
jgi:malonate decarboxylase epsilon subunit